MDPPVFGHSSFLSPSQGSEEGRDFEVPMPEKRYRSSIRSQYLKEFGSPLDGFSRWTYMSPFGGLAAFHTRSSPSSPPPNSQITPPIRPTPLEQPEHPSPIQNPSTISSSSSKREVREGVGQNAMLSCSSIQHRRGAQESVASLPETEQVPTIKREQDVPIKIEPESDHDTHIKGDCDSLEEGELRESVPALATFNPFRVQDQSLHLGSLDLDVLGENLVLLYFGVLAIQTLLLPRFQYSSTRLTVLWGVKLTMYGHTIATERIHTSQMEAKVWVCRAALKHLSDEHRRWVVPSEPAADWIDDNWDWVALLRDHCIQNGLPHPVYTKCLHDSDGYCFEIELQKATYSGPIRHYSGKYGAENSAAHRALYALLVFGNGDDSDTFGPLTLANGYENLLAQVPRPPAPTARYNETRSVSVSANACSHKHSCTPETDVSTSRKPKKRKYKNLPQDRTCLEANREPKPANSNLLPLSNSRLPPIEVPAEEEPSRWRFSGHQIRDRIGQLETYTERLRKVCDMLDLETPEIRVERISGRLIDNEGVYNAAAYFHKDPFLTRAGAIGRLDQVFGTKELVTESCANHVVKYLLRVVDEDTVLEQENALRRSRRDQWWDQARKSCGLT